MGKRDVSRTRDKSRKDSHRRSKKSLLVDSDDEDEDEADGVSLFKVEKIVDSRADKHGNTLYRVRWVGYSPNDDTWEPIGNVESTGHVDRYVRDERSKFLDKREGGVALIQYEDGENQWIDLKREKFRAYIEGSESDRDDDSADGDPDVNNFSIIGEGSRIELLWPHVNIYFEAKIISWTPLEGFKEDSEKFLDGPMLNRDGEFRRKIKETTGTGKREHREADIEVTPTFDDDCDGLKSISPRKNDRIPAPKEKGRKLKIIERSEETSKRAKKALDEKYINVNVDSTNKGRSQHNKTTRGLTSSTIDDIRTEKRIMSERKEDPLVMKVGRFKDDVVTELSKINLRNETEAKVNEIATTALKNEIVPTIKPYTASLASKNAISKSETPTYASNFSALETSDSLNYSLPKGKSPKTELYRVKHSEMSLPVPKKSSTESVSSSLSRSKMEEKIEKDTSTAAYCTEKKSGKRPSIESSSEEAYEFENIVVARKEYSVETDEYLLGINSDDDSSNVSGIPGDRVEEPVDRLGQGIPLFPIDEDSSDDDGGDEGDDKDECMYNADNEKVSDMPSLNFEQLWMIKLDQIREMMRN